MWVANENKVMEVEGVKLRSKMSREGKLAYSST